MRVVVAPDKFAGSLTAAECAAAFAAGWSAHRPLDTVELVPMSDGGPGFLDCLGTALPGLTTTVTVEGPDRRPVTGRLFRSGDTCYLEAADVVGRHLLPRPDPLGATSAGLGHLLRAPRGLGVRRIVVGLGGSATTDGGAGMLGALGAVAVGGDGGRFELAQGGGGLGRLAGLDLRPARAELSGIDLVAATDVDSVLLGPAGASRMFAAQKGASPAQIEVLEESLGHWAALAGPECAAEPGAGAAGGVGFGLLMLGARRVPGVDVVLAALDVPARCAVADLVVTGEGSFDDQSRHGKVVSGVAAAAGGRPVVVIAGRSLVTEAGWRAAGIARVETLRSRVSTDDESIRDAADIVRRIAAELADEAPQVARRG